MRAWLFIFIYFCIKLRGLSNSSRVLFQLKVFKILGTALSLYAVTTFINILLHESNVYQKKQISNINTKQMLRCFLNAVSG